VSTLPTLIQHSAGILCQSSKTGERSTRDSNKEEVKLSLFADYMILYLKDPKDATKKQPDFINT
jgi:hypothetical protein